MGEPQSGKLRLPPRRLRPLLLAFAAILALLVPGAHAAADKRKPKPKPLPDLVVASASKTGPPYAFEGESNPISYTVVVRNIGRGEARRSFTGLYLYESELPALPGSPTPHGPFFELHGVPALKAVTDKHHRNAHSGGHAGPLEVLGFEYGSYGMKVCADAGNLVKEKDETNNCKVVADPFYLTKRHWAGHVSGKASAPHGQMESWDGDLGLDFKEYLGGGAFSYATKARVTYSETGADGQCTWRGGATVTATTPESAVVLDYHQERYTGGTVTSDRYAVSETCPGGAIVPFPDGPVETSLLLIDPTKTQPLPLPFGTQVIEGSSNDSTNRTGPLVLSAEWHWKFT